MLFGIKLICDLVFYLHLFVIVAVFVLQPILGVHFDCIFVFLGLHRNNVIIPLLFIVYFLVRDESIEGFKGIGADIG